ncbi:MAG TPA: hypothetical protein VKR06_31850 [Ktedonosporobacter sp.]|nr:hypothetical protein [Ktedonosporobacter sp.]
MHHHISRLHRKLGSSPLILFILGALTILLWSAATVVQIQTSEYLALGNQARVAGVAWGVLLQPWQMLLGIAPLQYVTSWLYGWIVELVTLVFALALAVAIHKISAANSVLGKGFVIAGAALVLLNSWADYTSSPGANPLVQFLIALSIGLVVTVGLPLSIGLIERGFEEL